MPFRRAPRYPLGQRNSAAYRLTCAHPIADLDDLSDTLVRSKLVSYAEALREEVPALDTPDRLAAAMESHHLAVADAGSGKATNGAVLLFAKRPDRQVDVGWIDVTVSGPTAWVAKCWTRLFPLSVSRVAAHRGQSVGAA